MKKITLPSEIESHCYSGVCEAASGILTADIIRSKSSRVSVLVAEDFKHCISWAVDSRFFLPFLDPENKTQFYAYPEKESEDAPGAFDNQCDRLTVLTKLISESTPIVITATLPAILDACPPPEKLESVAVQLKTGDSYDFDTLISKLNEMGYYCEIVCEGPGQYAVRGGLIDVYPVNMNSPCRLDFFGDEIESISEYDPSTQLTRNDIDSISISPIDSVPDSKESNTLINYLPESTNWFFLEPGNIRKNNTEIFQSFEKIKNVGNNFNTIIEQRKGRDDCFYGFCELDVDDSFFNESETNRQSENLSNYRNFPYDGRFGLERLESERKARSEFFNQLNQWQDEGIRVHIIVDNKSEKKRLNDIIKEEGLKDFKPKFCEGDIRSGFILRFEDEENSNLREKDSVRGLAFVTRNEIFGTRRKTLDLLNKREKVLRANVDQILDFSELADGDYIVHLQHGICIYRGLQSIDDNDGESREVISLEFADDISIHLPLHESHLLSKYVGLSKAKPKLGKLGTSQWEKVRSAAERATLDFAAELLKTQAERNVQKAYQYSADTEWQKEFENAFIYKETADQLTAIQSVKEDMESDKPTDRLVCGDVGFGKTEVALRAAFKAVMDGKQVAILVPTTVLAQQHYITFKERMADYPVIVEMASRFRTPTQNKKILQQVNKGNVDVIVGTHRLLSKDVSFKDLGLIVIDEEHRFGVKHKEKLKQMCLNIDIISMSATPIPRTLYMALMGVRNLSVIETAPRDRLPIETLVKNYDPELIRKAVQREIDRGGQVFYLHNRVQTIHKTANDLQKILPDISIAVGHGQMDEKELEDIMTNFVDGKYDMLVCTTIVESGLDIPNCNTIIIEGADRFGLSQLYQLRGRVGRFKRQAYAYLLLHKKSELLDQARKRLSSLRQHNQLGAGFRIAMRDLELRGAGHLLGEKQSGHIAGVGFDLYCQLLRQSISRLKGEEFATYVRASLKIDFVVMGEGESLKSNSNASNYQILKQVEIDSESCDQIECFIPASYISESSLRIDFYRRLAMATKVDEIKETISSMSNRFGKLPKPVEALALCSEIRCLAEEKYITIVETEGNKLKCQRPPNHKQPLIKIGTRFPRLKSKNPFKRLKEISAFIKKQKK